MDLTTFNRIKSTLRAGDCLLYSGKDLLSEAIEKLSHSEYCHAGMVMVFSEYPDIVLTVEAEATGVVMYDLAGKLARETKKCTVFPLKPEYEAKRHEIGLCALKFLGMSYDYTYLFKLAVERVKINPKNTVCSEMLQRCYGIQGDILTPGDLSKLAIFGPPIKL
jgi:hypothetical protein